MSGNEKRIADRYAFFKAYDSSCAYCRRSLDFDSFEIEHIIPQRLTQDPNELEAVFQQFRLPGDFDLEGDLNKMAACGRCNRLKGGEVLPAAAYLLTIARTKAPIVSKYRSEELADRQKQRFLAEIHRWLDRDAELRQELFIKLRVEGTSLPPASPRPWPDNAAHLRAAEALGKASTSLLVWPATTDGHWFAREELNQLVGSISDEQCQLIALLGPPGSGKSAILSRLGRQLAHGGHTLLALKADLIPAKIASLRDLDEWLDVPEPLTVIVERLALEGPVTILIDQVDALSELMDAHTERLFALIALVDCILASSKAKVVISCRDFDAQHDLRLRGLLDSDRARKITVGDLEWISVKEFLQSRGFKPEALTDPAKRVICRPNALKLFVKFYKPRSLSPTFNTYQSMLGQVLHDSVITPFGAQALKALYVLARELAEREELWLPRAFLEDTFPKETNQLLAADWIQATPDGLRLGFTHQTLFDFIRARSFVSQGVSLFDEVNRRQASLAIRPVLWSASAYLRGADPASYSSHVGALLKSPLIRPHIKILLIDFLGSLTDPTAGEATWLRKLLQTPELRVHVIRATENRSEWFALLRNDLIDCRHLGPEAAMAASWALGKGLQFDRAFVVDALRKYWMNHPELDLATFNVFLNFDDWDDQSASLIKTVMERTRFAPVYVCRIARSVAKTAPLISARIVRSKLDQDLEQAKAECTPVPTGQPTDDSYKSSVKAYLAIKESVRPLTHLLRNHGDWHDLDGVAAAAPADFVEGLWTWVEAVETALNKGGGEARPGRYRGNHEWRFGQQFGSYLAEALWSAVNGFAKDEPDRFLKWVEQSSESEWMPVHVLIVYGLRVLAKERPGPVLSYLLADLRRLDIGNFFGGNAASVTLVKELAPVLAESEVERLRSAICDWQPYATAEANRPSSANTRFVEEIQAGLLDALSVGQPKSDNTASSTSEDEGNETSEGFAGFLESPVTAQDLSKMTDEQILEVFSQYPDERAADIVRQKAGAAHVAIQFGEFAKAHPERAVHIIHQLRPGSQEGFAGKGLEVLASSQEFKTEDAVQLAIELFRKGFSSKDFLRLWSWSMVSIANRAAGLSETTVNLLLGAIKAADEIQRADPDETNDPELSPVFQEQRRKPNRDSLLWDPQGGVLPDGNFPILLAITLGLLRRPSPDFSRLLEILEGHLPNREVPSVWRALLRYLSYVASFDRPRFQNLVGSLFRRFPEIARTVEAVRFVASSHESWPHELFEQFLRILETSGWDQAGRAIGEVLTLRVALVPTDVRSRDRLESALKSFQAEQTRLNQGLIRTAAETWVEPRSRDLSHRILLSAIPFADSETAESIMQAFSGQQGRRLPLDQYTSELLSKLTESPRVLEVRGVTSLIERLHELVANHYSPSEVASLTLAIVDANLEAIRNTFGMLPRSTDDIMNIAFTLQRFPETRARGTAIFERLLLINVHKAVDTARDVDRRF